ncbi:MAG: bifunctional ornithine acetyltransferase/N-acetylglutamate synthase [Kingella sp. (in: b-proteobacteria)]
MGHILTAIGYSGVDINIDALNIYLNDVLAIEHSSGYASYQAIQPIMNESEITIRVDLKTGKSQATIYTCA